MIGGLFWMAVANAAVTLGAHEILRRARTGQNSIDVVHFLLLRLALISATVLAAGLAGVLTPIGLGLSGSVVLAALLATGAHRRLPAAKFPDAGRLLWIVAGLLATRLLVQVWFVVPHLGDALAYHLPKVAEWVRAGALTREMGVHTHVTFPAGFELVETWWVVFLRHDLLIEMAGIEFLVLAFASVFALARHAGASERSAFFAGLLFVLAPGVHLSTLSCMNDVPAAALVLATAALAASRAPWAFVALVVGEGLGVKPTYGFALPGIVLLAWLVRREPSPARPAPGLSLALFATAGTLGGFWYARNALWFGNPFYPLGSPGFEDPTPVQFGPRLASLPENMANLINIRIYDGVTLYGANVDHMAGWGGAAFACGLVALVATARVDVRMRRLAACFAVSLLSALLLVQNDPWCLKYIFWFPAALFVATARLAEEHRQVALLAGAALAFAFLGTFFSYDLRSAHLRVLAGQPWRHRTAAAFPYAQAEAESAIPDDAIAYFGAPTGAPYVLYRPDFSRRVVYLRSTTPESLRSDLQSQNVRTIHVPEPTAQQKGILEQCLKRGWLTRKNGVFYHAE